MARLPDQFAIVTGETGARSAAAAAPRPVARGGLAAWRLRRIDNYLQGGRWNCTVDELAKLCGLSRGHLMRAFRQSTGRTLAAYVNELRLARACALLASDDVSIAAIAQDLQFSQPSGFAAAFRRRTGLSPRQYRQRGQAA